MQDWEAILRRGFESKELDYKTACEWDENDKKACCELVKDILAIANTKGGWLVVGVSEVPGGYSWLGLTDEQATTFDTTRLNRFLQNYTDPPINMHAIRHRSDGKTYVILEVPRFPDTPHICQRAFPNVLTAGALYVRTDNNESAPITKANDMRTLIEQATRNRSDQLLSSFRAILTGTPLAPVGPSDLEQFDLQIQAARRRCNEVISADLQSLGFRETIFHPRHFDRLRFRIPDLEQMIVAASIAYRGWPYVFYGDQRQDLINHTDDSLDFAINDEELQIWRIQRSGILHVRELFQEDEWSPSREQRVLGTTTFAFSAAEAVQCLANLYTGVLEDDEVVRLQMRLSGVRGRRLARVRGSVFVEMPYQCDMDEIVYDESRALAEWRAGVVPHAVEIVRYVDKCFHAPEPPYDELADLMQRLLDRRL